VSARTTRGIVEADAGRMRINRLPAWVAKTDRCVGGSYCFTMTTENITLGGGATATAPGSSCVCEAWMCADCKGEFGEDCPGRSKKDPTVCVDCRLRAVNWSEEGEEAEEDLCDKCGCECDGQGNETEEGEYLCDDCDAEDDE